MRSTMRAWTDIPPERPAVRRAGPFRHFFAGLAILYAAVAFAGFLPSYLNYRAGRTDISWAAHAHGAMMAAWLALLVTQSLLPAAGRLALHRRLGVVTAWFAGLIWASMIAVALRQIAVKAPPEGAFLYNILLLQLLAVLLFPLFLGWALVERRRPGWHKRLIVLAMLVPLGAAVDRMAWLPVGGVEHQWPYFLWLDLLLVPLLLFDWASMRRIHPATAIGASILAASQLLAALLWDTAGWHAFAYAATAGLR